MAANQQGKFWSYHSRLLANYKNLSGRTFKEIATELGLDMGKFNRDMNSRAVQKRIGQDLRNGRKVGVSGTPTVYINGRLLQNRSFQSFTEAIKNELAKQI